MSRPGAVVISPDSPEPSQPYNASREIVRGVSWAILMRWGMRAIGLVSTVILARLLSPEDFGVAAMGMLVIGLLYAFTEFGTSMHLIRVKEIDRAQCDTAWTITLLQNWLIALVIVLLAPSAAAYFQEPRVVEVMYVLAIVAFVDGFSSVGPTLLRRELKFDLDFRFNMYKKLLVFTATVGLALWLRSYWALVYGKLVGTVAGVVLSYVIHPYRPTWSLARAPEYLRFAVLIVLMSLADRLRDMAPKFMVGSLGSASTMGLFTVSHGLATLFTQETVGPMGRGLFPNYTKLASDKAKLSAIYRKVLAMVALVTIPVGVGVSAVAGDLVAVILGPKWQDAVPLIEYLAIGAVVYAISHTMFNQILLATGRERSATVLAWVRLIITVPILAIGLSYGGALGLAQATIIAPLACLPIIYLEIRRAVQLPVSTLIVLLWRPLLSALIMYLTVKLLHPEYLDWAILRLIWDAVVGAGVFVATMLVLWVLSGRPQGAERICIGFLEKAMR